MIYLVQQKQNTTYQEMTRKSQGKINQGGTVQREHKLRQGATKDFHSESGNQRQEKMREERSFTK